MRKRLVVTWHETWGQGYWRDYLGWLGTGAWLVERLSAAGRQAVEDRFDVHERVPDYQALYARHGELYRPLAAGALQYGSRLDQPWIPNPLVRLVRSKRHSKSR